MSDTSGRELHEDLAECLERVEAARSKARGMCDGLSSEQLNWRPDAKKWSVGECLEHLILSGETFLPRIEEAIRQGREKGLTGSGPFKHGFMGNMMVNMSGDKNLPPKRRFTAPKFARPATSHTIEETVPRFFALQDRLEQAIRDSNGLDLSRVKAPSPMPVLKFSLGQWLAMMTGHQMRHLWQAEQIREAAAFPS